MKECITSKGLGENLFGFVIPQGAIFGCVQGRYYICEDFNKYYGAHDTIIYRIRIYSRNKKRFCNAYTQNFPEIQKRIEAHLCVFPGKAGFECDRPELRTRRKDIAFHNRKRKEAAIEREYSDVVNNAVHEKRPPELVPFNGTYSQSRVDGKGYSIDWEWEVQEPEHNFIGGVSRTYSDDRSLMFKPFEHGQETSGHSGRYTVSPERFNRKDGLKTNFSKYRTNDSAKYDGVAFRDPSHERWVELQNILKK